MRRITRIGAVALALTALTACGDATKCAEGDAIEACVGRIKERIMFEENEVKGFTYSYTKAQESAYQYAYFVDVAYEDVYGAWAEDWLCGVSFSGGAVSEVNCTRLARFSA